MVETSEQRPVDWSRPALWTEENKTVLTVICFYWGVRKLIESVLVEHYSEPSMNSSVQGMENREIIAAPTQTSVHTGITYVSSGST